MNKVLYAREGAKNIMDRTLANFPKQIKLEVDGVEVELPEVDALHIHSFCLIFFKKLVWLLCQCISQIMTHVTKDEAFLACMNKTCIPLLSFPMVFKLPVI